MFDNPRDTLEQLGLVKRKGRRKRVEFDAPGWIRAVCRALGEFDPKPAPRRTPNGGRRYDQRQRAKARRRRNYSGRPRYKRKKPEAVGSLS